jgi:hypothetical protein
MTFELQPKPLPHDFIISQLTNLRRIRDKHLKQVSHRRIPSNHTILTHRSTVTHQTKIFGRFTLFLRFVEHVARGLRKLLLQSLYHHTKPQSPIPNGDSIAPNSEVCTTSILVFLSRS